MRKSFHCLKSLYRGGVETLVMNWYRYTDTSKYMFDFGLSNDEGKEFNEEIAKLGGHIFVVDKNLSIWKKFTYLFRLFYTLKKNGPYHTLFAHEQCFGGLSCMVAFLAGIPKRVTVAHWAMVYQSNKFIQWFYRLLCRLFVTDCLAVSSNAGLIQYGKNISFTVIRTGIDISKFSYQPKVRLQMRSELGIDDNTLVIGNVSRLTADKNISFLLDIFEIIHRIHPNSIFLQCGEGDQLQILKNKTAKLNLTPYVLWQGNCPNVQNYYQAMDAFVFPSELEGLGIVAIEAQCAGLPCFISDGVPAEAVLCNTLQIPLKESSQKWAELILEKIKNFSRQDTSALIKKAGFDIKDAAKFIEQNYL